MKSVTPTISIVLPTYNNERTIRQCLKSIFSQDYPKNCFEVIIIDGGSTDKTLDIVKQFPTRLFHNKKRVEEAGRTLGISKAKNEIIGFVDADNVFLDKDFLTTLAKPFQDTTISFADTLYFSFTPKDNFITTYCALLSGDDPFSIYLGLNDRLCFFNNKWTGKKHLEEDKKDYLKVTLFPKHIPTMGSNGFFVRKKALQAITYKRFIHTDIVNKLVNKGFTGYAKIRRGVKHDLADVQDFFTKKARRVKRRLQGEIELEFPYTFSPIKLIGVSLLFATFIVPLFDMIRGFVRKPNKAWLFHPVACFGVLCVYAWYTCVHFLKKSLYHS